MHIRLFLFLSGFFFSIQFIIFSYLVHKDIFQQFDFDTTVRLQDNISSRFDTLFSVFSEVGKFEISIIVLLVLLLSTRKMWASFIGICLFGIFHVIEIFGKFFVDHIPPPQFMLKTQHLVDFPQYHLRAENSYPSGHSGRAMFISAILMVIILQNKKIPLSVKIVLCSLIVLYDGAMLISRVYLGEHWSTDVIGGAMLGLGTGLLSTIFLAGRGKIKFSIFNWKLKI